jgi:nickel-dependent lactate racemase
MSLMSGDPSPDELRVRLEFGKTGLEVDLPRGNVAGILTIQDAPVGEEPRKLVREALLNPIGTRPLSELAVQKRNACIVVCDVTRPVPNPIILPEVLSVLEQVGIERAKITILIATGTHRGNSPEELQAMLGTEGMACRVVNHDCTAHDDMIALGTSPHGVPIFLNRHFVMADLKITIGMIEPHFMAGFAGGRKMVMPGVAGLETIQAWHSPAFLEHPLATNGAVAGNPVHEEARWIANQCRPDFIVDVALDRSRQISKVFAGDMDQAWMKGVEFVRNLTEDTVEGPIDICVTTCGGFPLDLTFYQTVKGIVGPLPIVRAGGAIIVASACDEGVGNPHFLDALLRVGDIHTWLDRAISGDWERVPDQWQIEELAKAVRTHRVYVVARGIASDLLGRLHVHPCESVEQAVQECLAEFGSDARIAVIPKGPYVIPRLRERS